MTAPFNTAAVIGLGLIGGSVARDLHALGVTVLAYDADPVQLAHAVRDGVVDRRLSAGLEELADADLVVLAVPVNEALRMLRRAAPFLGATALVTDVGSTKGSIVALATELELGERFVGAHPMAGDHRSGWGASRVGLFLDAPLYLCPTPRTTPRAMALATSLWRQLGARPIEMDASEHDERLAWTSHLPHMVAVVLGLTLREGRVSRDDLGPGGRDMTRIAGSSPEMWTAISIDNAEPIATSLAVAERELRALREEVERCDADALHARFAAARAWFSEVPSNASADEARRATPHADSTPIVVGTRGPSFRSD